MRQFVYKLVLIIFMVNICVYQVFAGRKSRVNKGKNADHYWPKLKWMLIGIFAPVIFYFFLSLARDPALPQVMKEFGFAIRERFANQIGPTPKYKRR